MGLTPRTWCLIALFVFPVALVLASWRDNTLLLSAPGKGLSQHYGVWTMFATTPIILMLSSHLILRFARVVQDVDGYCIHLTAQSRRQVTRLIDRHLASLALRSRSAWVLVFTILAMSLWCVINVQRTMAPTATYGHDVFDSYAHLRGFIVMKAYVFVVFGIVYAVATFVAVHVTYSMISLLRFLQQQDLIAIDLFHSDNCGGTSRFGNINLEILALYANYFAVIVAMYATHRTTYLVMVASLLSCSLLAAVQSVIAVYHIHRAIKRKKSEYVTMVTRRLNDQLGASLRPRGTFPNDLLAFRNHILAVRTFPYQEGAEAAVNVIRFAPAAIAVVGLLQAYL